MLERVHVQPELAAFESLIRDRAVRLATFEDERFARPDRVERDPATGELTVLAEFITGSRLSDLLEATADASIVPGVDVALGYLLENLPALTLLHKSGLTHGLIDASRTVLTPDGQFVFLDPSFGSAVERLNLPRLRLWHRFGVASPTGDGAVHFDAASDIAQVTLGGVALVLGRNLRLDEYPEALPSLLMEVIEVAQIRGSSAFATGLQRFLQRSLPIPGRRPYATADEAVSDVRQLVRREIGVDVCRQAVIDFATQMDGAFSDATDHESSLDDRSARRNPAAHSPRVPELDEFLESFEAPRQADAAVESTNDDAIETELTFDNLEDETERDPEGDVETERASQDREHHDREPQGDRDDERQREHDREAQAERDKEFYDLPPLDEAMAEANILAAPPSAVHGFLAADPSPIDVPIDTAIEDVADSLTPEETSEKLAEEAPVVAAAEPDVEHPPLPTVEEPPAEVLVSTAAVEPVVESQPTSAPSSAIPAVELEPEAEPEKDSASSRRRKRQQQKSARARKDKLRSTTSGQKTPPPPAPPPEPARPANPSGWLVSPQRAAQFEPPVPIHQPAPFHPPAPPAPPPPPPPVRPAPIPAVPSFVPTPVGHMPQPVYPSSVVTASAYGTSSVPAPATPGPLAPPVQQSPQPSGQVKLKADPPSGFTPRRSGHQDSAPVHVPADRYGTLGLGRGDSIVEDEPRSFPWKLAAIAVAVAGIAIFVGRTYLPGRTAVPGEPGAQVEAPATSPTAAPTTDAETPIPAGRGRLVIQTQPAGIKVLLDRKPVGETPLKLDVPPGRHILTFQTTGGEIVKSVRTAAGKTETLDIPVFSGWVAVFAPIVLQVAADGRSIGTTEQSRLMLPPGRHQLTLTNKELGYTAVEQVDIEPGEVKSVNVNPRGTVNLNAVPWAEVWLDGQKLGDTPLADMPVPLGQREFVFKNPQFGEKKVSATIKAGANSPVTVDFSK